MIRRTKTGRATGEGLSTVTDADRRRRSRGQVLVIFAGALFLLMMIAAVVVDVSWFWVNALRVQRAADAAALAGAVELPKYPDAGSGHAYDLAYKEALKNGYANGVGGVSVIPLQDKVFSNRLNVTITAPVGTFFMKVIGISTIPVTRTAKGEYVQPVPLGSPQNYFGVGYLVKPQQTTTTNTSTSNGTTDNDFVTHNPFIAGGQWSWTPTSFGRTIATAVDNDNDNEYAFTSTTGQHQEWGNFNLVGTGGGLPNLAANQTMTIRGVRVYLDNTYLTSSCSGFGRRGQLQADLSWGAGANGTWSSQVATGGLPTSSNNDETLGSTTGNSWGSHTWTRADFDNSKFQVRLTYDENCTNAPQVRVDRIRIEIGYSITTTTTTTVTTLQQNAPVVSPTGGTLSPQNFWAAMQSQGAPNIQGDAFMTKYERRKGTLNDKDPGQDPDANYLPDSFYNYAVEVPAGASSANVYVYDPGFCDTTSEGGLGEYWSGGTSSNGEDYGPSNEQPISTFFDLYNTNGTLGNNDDDTLVNATGNAYRRLSYQDYLVYDALNRNTDKNDCTNQAWHYGWRQLNSGPLGAGTYRIHVYSTDPSSANDQNDSTALNAYAFYANATGGNPRIYGIGAMEAYIRLPGGRASEFYLAQIDAANAGKIMYIDLWDPGDTGQLSANLQILAPRSGGWTATSFSYQGSQGTTNRDASSSCNNRSGTSTSVTTNTGGTSLYNGCWLRIQVAIPDNYSAPVDPVSGEKGWWKIRYNMGGSSSDFSTDLTTWQVTMHNNPVHLVIP